MSAVLYTRERSPEPAVKLEEAYLMIIMIIKLLQCLSNCALTKLVISHIYSILKRTMNNLFLFQDVPNMLELAFWTFFYRSKNSV